MYQKIPKLAIGKHRDYIGQRRSESDLPVPCRNIEYTKSSIVLTSDENIGTSKDRQSRLGRQKSHHNLEMLNKYLQPLAFEKYSKKRILKNMGSQNQTNTKLKDKNIAQYGSRKQLHSPYRDEEVYKVRSHDKYGKYDNRGNYADKLDFKSKKVNHLKQTSETISSNELIKHQLFRQKSPRHTRPITTFTVKDFKKIKQMGKGKTGKVWLAQQRLTGFLVALKMIDKTLIKRANNLDQFIRELKIQAFINNPSIIQLYGFFQDAFHFYIILEFGCDGQLYDLIQKGIKFSEPSISSVMNTLLTGVDYLHEHQILHRDIKPQNIVLSYGVMKLCDFGCAVKIKQNQLRTTFCGTPLYFSPQLLKEKKYNQKVDIWSLGILAYELYFECSPFQIETESDIEKIVTDKINFPQNQKISQEFKSFLLKILEKNPNKRLNCKKLLNMPFIKKFQDTNCSELLKA